VNYPKLSSVTIQNAYRLPRRDEFLDALVGSKYFSTLDRLSGYWQVPSVLMQGSIHHHLATFQPLMEQVLNGLHWKTLLI